MLNAPTVFVRGWRDKSEAPTFACPTMLATPARDASRMISLAGQSHGFISKHLLCQRIILLGGVGGGGGEAHAQVLFVVQVLQACS